MHLAKKVALLAKQYHQRWFVLANSFYQFIPLWWGRARRGRAWQSRAVCIMEPSGGVCLSYCVFNFPLFLLNLDSQPSGEVQHLLGKYLQCFSSCCDKALWPSSLQQNRLWQLTIAGTVCPLCRGAKAVGAWHQLEITGYTASISRKRRKMNVCCYTVFPFIYSRIPTKEWFIHISIQSSHINY